MHFGKSLPNWKYQKKMSGEMFSGIKFSRHDSLNYDDDGDDNNSGRGGGVAVVNNSIVLPY